MTEWATSGAVKIERAKEHIADFELASRTFLKTHTYSAVSQFDPQLREIRFVVREGYTVPGRLGAITADAIHNLRASLDILWHQTIGTPGKRKQYFPVFQDAHELETRFKSVKQTSLKAAVDILRTANFCKSGHKLLWALKEIDDRDKHELPVLAAATYKRVIMKLPPDVAIEGKTGVQLVGEISSGFLFLEHGTELPLAVSIETDAGPIMDMECELTADIAFGQGEILEGEPVLKTLHEIAQLVDGITDAFVTAGRVR
jgi:hypothetical protein